MNLCLQAAPPWLPARQCICAEGTEFPRSWPRAALLWIIRGSNCPTNRLVIGQQVVAQMRVDKIGKIAAILKVAGEQPVDVWKFFLFANDCCRLIITVTLVTLKVDSP